MPIVLIVLLVLLLFGGGGGVYAYHAYGPAGGGLSALGLVVAARQ